MSSVPRLVRAKACRCRGGQGALLCSRPYAPAPPSTRTARPRPKAPVVRRLSPSHFGDTSASMKEGRAGRGGYGYDNRGITASVSIVASSRRCTALRWQLSCGGLSEEPPPCAPPASHGLPGPRQPSPDASTGYTSQNSCVFLTKILSTWDVTKYVCCVRIVFGLFPLKASSTIRFYYGTLSEFVTTVRVLI